jgi:hypothetical protein
VVKTQKVTGLHCPSGRILIKDGNSFGYGPQRAIPVIPGVYDIEATTLHQGDVSMLAYLIVVLSEQSASRFGELTPTHTGESVDSIPEKNRGGFFNRSAYALMVDEQILKEGIPTDDDHCYSLVCHWQNHVEDKKPDWEGCVYELGGQPDENLVYFKTRQLSGLTKLYGEFDDLGMLLRVHVDLGLMHRF